MEKNNMNEIPEKIKPSQGPSNAKQDKTRISKNDLQKLRIEALKHIQSVSYSVSLRWTFYRILQDGKYIKTKKDWDRFKGYLSTARKQFLDGWTPSTLTDDTRNIIGRGGGFDNKKDWYEAVIEQEKCNLNKIRSQDYYLMIWFEAKAMVNQFKHYTKNIPLCAFGGDVSIPMKWEIAKSLERAKKVYDKPIVVLYFGDCDKKGNQIYESALKDIREWCDVDFDFVYCGLTEQQAKALNLPTNPEKENEFQWEALTDGQAMQIIETNVEKFQDKSRWDKIIKKEDRITKEFQKLLESKDTKKIVSQG